MHLRCLLCSHVPRSLSPGYRSEPAHSVRTHRRSRRFHRIHSQTTSTSLVEIAHNVTGVFVRNSDLHAYDRLKEYRRGIHKAFLERQDRRHLERHLGRVYRMIRSIVKCSLNAYYRISCQRSLLNAFLKSLLNCREVVLRNSASYYLLFEYIWCIKLT